LAIGERGIDPESGVVGLLRKWVAAKRSSTRRYEISKHDAAVVLIMAAGWPDCLYI
jgi:hypothetical protein